MAGSIISFFNAGPAADVMGSNVCNGSGTMPAQTTIWYAVFMGLRSIFSRVQAAGAGVEGDVHAFRVVWQGLAAIPQAGAAMDAFFAVKIGHTVRARRDGLAAAHLDADLRPTFLTEFREKKGDVVGVPRRGLHLAAHEQRVLV